LFAEHKKIDRIIVHPQHADAGHVHIDWRRVRQGQINWKGQREPESGALPDFALDAHFAAHELH